MLVGVIVALAGGCGAPTSPGGGGEGPSSPNPAVELTQDALLTAAEMPSWNGAMGWAQVPPAAGTPALAVCELTTPDA